MNFSKVTAVYFSPNGSTKKIVRAVAEKIAGAVGAEFCDDNFTLPKNRVSIRKFSASDIVVVGTPTYAGRVPNKILPDFMEKITGCGAVAVPVVTFGNRNYDSSLAELCGIMRQNGFFVAAAGAFVCRHVFSEKIAAGRPDASDEYCVDEFAEKVFEKLQTAYKTDSGNISDAYARTDVYANNLSFAEKIVIGADAAGSVGDYYVPLGIDGNPAKFLKAKPQTKLELCSSCGACARRCPMGAISVADTSDVTGTCIKCQACVHVCTKKAKYFDDVAFLSHVEYLEQHFTRRAENKMFV